MPPWQIYNSRNYKALIDSMAFANQSPIYNSRNYKALIDRQNIHLTEQIYNSRNYKALIDQIQKNDDGSDLQ